MTVEGVITEVEDVVGFTLKGLAEIYAIPGAAEAIDKLFGVMKTGNLQPSELALFLEGRETVAAVDEIEKDFPNGGKV